MAATMYVVIIVIISNRPQTHHPHTLPNNKDTLLTNIMWYSIWCNITNIWYCMIYLMYLIHSLKALPSYQSGNTTLMTFLLPLTPRYKGETLASDCHMIWLDKDRLTLYLHSFFVCFQLYHLFHVLSHSTGCSFIKFVCSFVCTLHAYTQRIV